MKRETCGFGVLVAAVVGLALANPVLADSEAGIGVQLNKLETDGEDCRAHLVLENGLEHELESFQPDLVVFDEDGIIARRMVVETGPLRAGSTSVKAFRLEGLACERVGRVLLNDIAACEGPDGPVEGCEDRVSVESLADVPLIR